MERSILYFDIDGTILTEDGSRRIPDSTRQALQKAKEQGHLLFVNTGRVFLNVEPMIRSLGFDGYVCGCGTQILYQGKELLHHQVPKKLCRETVEITRQCRMDVLYEASDRNALEITTEGNEAFQSLIEYFTQDGRRLVSVEDEEFYFDKFTAWYELEAANPLHDRFRSFASEHYEYIDRGVSGRYGMCEIVPKGFSKGSGIEYLAEYFQIPLERSYAFGDSTNDLPMLLAAGHSVAMGGSADIVKQSVEYVTDAIEQDGLWNAMQHYGLL
jgi:hypothetical protein